METVAQMKDTNIDKILVPTISAFIPLLEKNRDEILATPKRTFRYGDADRHQLDIYYPIDSTEGKTAPFYSSSTLGYSCLGSYFARKGFITIIPDYRLVPEIIFPQPAEDLRDAIQWVVGHPEHLREPYTPTPKPNLDSIFISGHSAGSAHLWTLLLLPELLDSTDLRARIKGAISFAGPYSFKGVTPADGSAVVLQQYFGSLDKAGENCALSLLERAPDRVLESLPGVLVLESEREPAFLYTRGFSEFPLALEKIGKVKVEKYIAKGHNHISPSWALSSGQGEEWAEKVVDWIKSSV
ncbi:Alpha/Beta hydrolase protein [Cyathus striatus]|nr:Alpha/Beta hydrolase protein [Cyathus striatus]